MPKINQEEYEILKNLYDKWKWIARDKDGVLGVYDAKVVKTKFYNFWIMAIKRKINSTLFSFIQWEDEEPYNIAELIEEYESEETEVKKDLNWFKEEVEIDIDNLWFKGKLDVDSVESLISRVNHLIDQLDEPEVLSQEWVKGHEQQVHPDHPSNAWWVLSDDLQNLLVPKQEITEEHGMSESEWVEVIDRYKWHLEQEGYEVIEKPVIPKFVADWIEEVKPDNSLRVAFEYIAQQKRDNYDDELAFWVEEGNSELFARAWLDGYTVEEEQKYYVINKQGAFALRKDTGGVANSIYTKKEVERLGELQYYQLTEQEIKDYDPRYFAFAVPVEELEE